MNSLRIDLLPTRLGKHDMRVRYAASCFVNKALTWWNTQVQARGREAAIGANHVAYIQVSMKLAKLVLHLVTPDIIRENQRKEGTVLGTVRKVAPKMAGRIRRDAQGSIGFGGKTKKHPKTIGTKLTRKAFNRNAVEALQDPKVVTGTFALNNQFATILFDSGSDFSFISTKFAPLLNMEPCIVNPGYAIEIVDGKSVKVDKVIRDCKLELGNSLFTIDLIPLGHGSFDVIMGMDWLPKNKAVIVCHEKVVEIPIDEGDIL
ncbi:putative reverse transcriptase domain-containing protein [Tanacetum coccineum]